MQPDFIYLYFLYIYINIVAADLWISDK